MGTFSTVGNFRDEKGGVELNSKLLDVLRAAAALSPYNVEAFSGVAARSRGTPNHPGGHAVDVYLVDPQTGQRLSNYQTAATFKEYERFAQMARVIQQDTYPELDKTFRWGGYFGTGGDQLDLMHFDVTPSAKGKTLGGNWADGASEAFKKKWGITDSNPGLSDSRWLNQIQDQYRMGKPYLPPGLIPGGGKAPIPAPRSMIEDVRAGRPVTSDYVGSGASFDEVRGFGTQLPRPLPNQAPAPMPRLPSRMPSPGAWGAATADRMTPRVPPPLPLPVDPQMTRLPVLPPAERRGVPGMIEPGNIDLTRRPQVVNADGSISTVKSASFDIDGREVLLPTISPDGRRLSDDEAVELYRETGRHLGVFSSPEAASTYSKKLSEQMRDNASMVEARPGRLSDEFARPNAPIPNPDPMVADLPPALNPRTAIPEGTPYGLGSRDTVGQAAQGRFRFYAGFDDVEPPPAQLAPSDRIADLRQRLAQLRAEAGPIGSGVPSSFTPFSVPSSGTPDSLIDLLSRPSSVTGGDGMSFTPARSAGPTGRPSLPAPKTPPRPPYIPGRTLETQPVPQGPQGRGGRRGEPPSTGSAPTPMPFRPPSIVRLDPGNTLEEVIPKTDAERFWEREWGDVTHDGIGNPPTFERLRREMAPPPPRTPSSLPIAPPPRVPTALPIAPPPRVPTPPPEPEWLTITRQIPNPQAAIKPVPLQQTVRLDAMGIPTGQIGFPPIPAPRRPAAPQFITVTERVRNPAFLGVPGIGNIPAARGFARPVFSFGQGTIQRQEQSRPPRIIPRTIASTTPLQRVASEQTNPGVGGTTRSMETSTRWTTGY